MLFNSWEFLIFLPIVLGLYYLLHRSLKAQNIMLLAASYVFYGWWDWRFLSLILISSLLDFFCGRAIDRSTSKRRKTLFLVFSIAGNLGILGFFKYFNFFVDSAAGLLSLFGLQAHMPTLMIILPVGISFYTFQTMSYTLDIYKGKFKPTNDFLNFMLYVSYFPQLVAGPIERASHLLPELEKPRSFNRQQILEGVTLILIGYFRKVVIADNLAPMVERAFSDPTGASSGLLLGGLYAFALQIYGDFAGYSDIARGISKVMGIELMVNFQQPYFSTSITEFWRRWHISLSSWLRDYLYIDLLGGNKKGKFRTYLNLFLTMFLGGLWHGAGWTFVVWGILNGIYLAAEKMTLFARRKFEIPEPRASFGTWIVRLLRMVFVFHLVCLTWIFFRAPNFTLAFQYLIGIFSNGGWLELLSPGLLFAWLAILAIDVPIYLTRDHTVVLRLPRLAQVAVLAAIILIIITYSASGKTPFIYFQF